MASIPPWPSDIPPWPFEGLLRSAQEQLAETRAARKRLEEQCAALEGQLAILGHRAQQNAHVGHDLQLHEDRQVQEDHAQRQQELAGLQHPSQECDVHCPLPQANDSFSPVMLVEAMDHLVATDPRFQPHSPPGSMPRDVAAGSEEEALLELMVQGEAHHIRMQLAALQTPGRTRGASGNAPQA